MGYTTEFEGKFELDKLPAAEVILQLNSLADLERGTRKGDMPDSYCDWELTKDLQHIKWNGAEKFYYYKEWLQYIIDNILKPNRLTLSGSVKYKGESFDDFGVLAIEDGVVVKTKAALIDDNFEELKKFKDFVLQSKYSDLILEDWTGRR